MLRRCTKPAAASLALLEMPAATRRATRTAANILTATPAEAALLIACALIDPRDLLALALAVPPRFANKCIAAPPPHRSSASGTTAATQQALAPVSAWCERLGQCTSARAVPPPL